MGLPGASESTAHTYQGSLTMTSLKDSSSPLAGTGLRMRWAGTQSTLDVAT